MEFRLDRIGNKTYIGDKVAFAPYHLNDLYAGKVVRFTPKMVEIKGDKYSMVTARFVKVIQGEANE